LGDAAQLEQAFLNLLLNAAEAMPGGGMLRIRSWAESDGSAGYADVSFSDTGSGMTEEQRARAFTSVLSTRKPGGTGLGLAIVGRVVETHRGKVRIESEPGKGTTVMVMLPVK
jgi:signal transduction histidine kinase